MLVEFFQRIKFMLRGALTLKDVFVRRRHFGFTLQKFFILFKSFILLIMFVEKKNNEQENLFGIVF